MVMLQKKYTIVVIYSIKINIIKIYITNLKSILKKESSFIGKKGWAVNSIVIYF
jgi:hypothetical protein